MQKRPTLDWNLKSSQLDKIVDAIQPGQRRVAVSSLYIWKQCSSWGPLKSAVSVRKGLWRLKRGSCLEEQKRIPQPWITDLQSRKVDYFFYPSGPPNVWLLAPSVLQRGCFFPSCFCFSSPRSKAQILAPLCLQSNSLLRTSFSPTYLRRMSLGCGGGHWLL